MCWKPLLLVFFLSYSPVINSDLIHSDNVFRTKDRAETCVKDCDSEKDCYINRTRCLDGKCGCVHNYQFNSNCSRCIKCPGLDSKCNTQCCYGSDLYCNPGSGKCESCIKDGKYICRSILHDDLQSENIEARSDSNQNQDLLMTATQIAMSGALTLGIITILILFWKLCAKTERRRQGRSGRGPRASNDSAASGGSLQRAVAERMRDAPPPYCRALPPPGDTPPPYHTVNNSGYVNASFEGDFSLPPPDYNIAVGDSSSSISSTTPSTEQQAKSITSESHQNVEAKNTEIVSNSTALHI